MLEILKQNNCQITYCLVGEPTNPEKFGEMIKVKDLNDETLEDL